MSAEPSQLDTEAPATVPAPASEQEQKLAPLIERQRELNRRLAELARHDARRAKAQVRS